MYVCVGACASAGLLACKLLLQSVIECNVECHRHAFGACNVSFERFQLAVLQVPVAMAHHSIGEVVRVHQLSSIYHILKILEQPKQATACNVGQVSNSHMFHTEVGSYTAQQLWRCTGGQDRPLA